jgi:hypothetical protein
MALVLFHLAVLTVFATEPTHAPLDAVVLVQQGSTTCAGAIIDSAGRVATAYHCVAPGGRPRVTTRTGLEAVGRVSAVRTRQDLAVIEVPALAGQPSIPLRERPPVVGEAVFALGHPYGVRQPYGFLEGTLRWSMTEGIVSAVGPSAVQISAPVNPGNSGGPIVDAEGQLIGVVSRKSAGGEGLGFGGLGLSDLLQADRRGLGAFGGTLGASVFLTTLEAGAGSLSLGVRPEVAFRDRVLVSAAVGLSPGAKWGAVRFGETRWVESEARLSVRQRLFSGPYTTRVDAWVSWATVVRLTGRVEQGRVAVTREAEPAPFLGGTLSVGRSGFEMGVSPTTGALTASFVYRWPGVMSVF